MNSIEATNIYAYVQQHSSVILEYIETLGSFGLQPEGGIIRPVYSPPWLEAHKQLALWMEQAGLALRTDAIGNLWGRAEGRETGPVIASGSHLDTVKGGGKYDGALGIIAALCAIRFLKEFYGPSRLPLEVVALCEEEGSRFHNTFLGSKSIIGALTYQELESCLDPQNISIAQAARACGFEPDKLNSARRYDLGAFIELHIEQGRVLDDAGIQVGVVQAITGLQHLNVIFSGRADHAGTTPMNVRADALVSAAEAIGRVNELARELGHPAVATVGSLKVTPDARNIVPEGVEMSIDLRHSDPALKNLMSERIHQICKAAAAKQGVGVEIELQTDRLPAPMSPEISGIVLSSARTLEVSAMKIVSGAGHDSQVIVEQVPTGMIFVPSQNGRSHSQVEYTPMEQIVPGIAVLAQTLHDLAY